MNAPSGEPPPLPADPRRQAAERAAASALFRKTPKLREFLLFICERAISGNLDDIREQQIGHAVFGRPLGFDTSADNVVRASARQLRQKLDEYYQAEGAAEPLRIEIPKGTYVPIFRELELAAAANAVLPAAPRPFPVWWFGVAAALLLAAGAAVIILIRTRPASPSLRPSAIWTRFAGDGAIPLRILTSDASFQMIQEAYPRPITLSEYMGARFPWALPGISEERLQIAHNGMTDLSDVLVSTALARLAGPAVNLEVHQPRQLPALSLPRSNVVVLGGARTNPWSLLFRNERAYRLRQTGSLCIDVAQPVAAEKAEYCHGAGHGFGSIALLPNPHGEGAALLLDGTTPPLTVAASRFLTDPELYDRVAARLGNARYFEILFRAEVVRAAAGEIEIVAIRQGLNPAR